MAGIGFQLKELYDQSNFLSQLRAIGYSAVVAAGPMFLTIVLVTLTREWMLSVGTPLTEVNLFMAGTQYSFIFSQIITGGFLFVISRYVADQTFMEKEENVLSSMYGVLSVTSVIGAIATIIFYWDSPLTLLFKLLTYLLFITLMMIWILSMYVSALKDYKKIIISYLVGIVVSAILVWFFVIFMDWKEVEFVFIGIDIGFLITGFMLLGYVKKYFQINNRKYFQFLIYIEKYPLLFLIGLLFYLGLYGHSFIVWQGDYKIVIADTFVIATYYDIPVFYAYLSILPSLILFMVTIETSFYKTYKKYYGRILNGAPLRDIVSAQKEMYRVLKLELVFLAQVQLLVVFTFIFLGVKLLPRLGLTQGQIDIFTISVIGIWFLGLMVTIFLVLLYFDEQRFAMWTSLTYFISSILLTGIAMIGFDQYGVGIFLSSFIGAVVSLQLLTKCLNNLDYNTFCSQPIIYVEKKTRMERLLK